MTEQDYSIARSLRERVSKIVPVLDLRVFGSHAKGTADENSDMDVFLEVPFLDRKLKNLILDVTWEVGFKNSTVISLLIFTEGELRNSPLRVSPIVENIMVEGIKI